MEGFEGLRLNGDDDGPLVRRGDQLIEGIMELLGDCDAGLHDDNVQKDIQGDLSCRNRYPPPIITPLAPISNHKVLKSCQAKPSQSRCLGSAFDFNLFDLWHAFHHFTIQFSVPCCRGFFILVLGLQVPRHKQHFSCNSLSLSLQQHGANLSSGAVSS